MSTDERSDSSTNTVLVVIGVVVGVLLLVVLACGALGFLAFRAAGTVVAPMVQAAQEMEDGASAAEEFLQALSEGKVDVAYKSTTPAFQAHQTPEQFKAFLDKNPLLTDKFAARVPNAVNQAPGAGRMTVPYTLSRDGFGLMDLTIHLVDDDGEWKVDALTVP